MGSLHHLTGALVAASLSLSVNAQSPWQGLFLPGALINAQYVHCDTASHTVYYTGLNNLMGDFTNMPGSVLAWRNEQWDTIAYNQHGTLERLVMFHDTLILEGASFIESDTVDGIAYFNGEHWVSFPDQPDDVQVQRFRVIDDTLYAAMTSGLVVRQPFFRLVNGHWEPFGFMPGLDYNIGADIVKYAGAFYGTVVGGAEGNGVYRLEDTTWTSLGPEITGTGSSPSLLSVFQGDLYIGGYLQMNTGVPGQGICRYDGENFFALGMGLQMAPGNNNSACGAVDMIAHGNYLFVSTGCDYIGGMYCPGIGAWDGSRWCTVEGVLVENNAGAWSMDFIGDTLYVGCGQTISGVDVGHAARFIGPDFADSCGTITFVPLDETVQERTTLYPNPVSEVLSISFGGMHTHDVPLRIIDSRGVVRWIGQARPQDLDVRDWAKGVYQLVAPGRGGVTQRLPFVVQ